MAELKRMVGTPGEAESLYLSPYYDASYDFPWNPDPLASGNDYKIYDEMLDDDQVKIAMEVKKDFVVNTGWQVVCKGREGEYGEEVNSPEQEEIEEFATGCLKAIGDTEESDLTFDDALRDMLSAYAYGFSLTEPVFILDEAVGKYRYSKLCTRPPHTFRFDLDPKGVVRRVIQATQTGDKSFEPGRFLHFVYQPEYGNPYGRSDLRAAHAAWKAKKWVLKFFARHLERFGSPTVVGRYNSGMDQASVTRLHFMLTNLQNGTVYTLPNDAQIEFVAQQHDAGAAFVAALNFYNMQIARALLVPDLIGIGGGKTEAGSYALGKEQFNLFYGLIAKNRKSLERKITEKILRPLIRSNFPGDNECEFRFLSYKDTQDSDLLRVWMEAAKGRMFQPNPEEINKLRELAGMPQGPVEVAPVLEAGGKTPEGGDEGSGGKERTFALGPSRELNQYEKKVDLKAVARFREDQEGALSRRLRAAGKAVWSDYIDQVRGSTILERKDVDRLNHVEPRFLKDMNDVLRRHFSDLYREAYRMARREVFPNGDRKFAEEELLPEVFLKMLKAEAFTMVGDYSVHVTKRARNLIIQGLKEGRPAAELFSAVRAAMEEESDKWIQTVVATKTTEYYNRARKSYWDNDPLASQIVVAYEYSAVLDDRTTEICSRLDGKVFEKGGNIPTPPLHFNCRSDLIPVTIFEDYRAAKNPSPDDLADMGAGKAFVVPKFASLGRQMISGDLDGTGDHVLIASPGAGKHLVVYRVMVALRSETEPCGIGFKEGVLSDAKMKNTLQPRGLAFSQGFAQGWHLPEDTELVLEKSAPSGVSYTAEYEVI